MAAAAASGMTILAATHTTATVRPIGIHLPACLVARNTMRHPPRLSSGE